MDAHAQIVEAARQKAPGAVLDAGVRLPRCGAQRPVLTSLATDIPRTCSEKIGMIISIHCFDAFWNQHIV